MDAEKGNSWENDDGTISIVKTEIEDYESTEHNNIENDIYNNENEYGEHGFHEQFVPKQENFEPEHSTHFDPSYYQDHDYIPNNYQQTSSSMGVGENWPLLQGYSIPESDPQFMNQPGTSDIGDLTIKHEAELYPCNYCDYVGTHPKLLASHIKNRHIKSVVYQCPHCQYNSTVARNTRDHIQCKHLNEDDDKPIMKRKCEFCDYCASNATALKNHMNKHTKEVKHQCSFCEFNTLWEGYLKMHIRRKHSDQTSESGTAAKEYPCQYCDYKAATPSTLKLHTNKHTREQEHQCPYCPYKTVWTTYIKLHIQNKHFKDVKTPSTKEHPCSFCDYKAKNSTLLRQHLNKHTREKVHQCPHCPFNTLWVTYMKLHIKRKHTENNENEVIEKKDFQCQYCPYKAISLSHLKIHENKHTKAIEYKCNVCDFKTSWFGYLRFHIQRKHSLKSDIKEEDKKKKTTFPCSFCPYKAINLSTLKVHQNKHTRENIYNCPHCEFKTTWRAYIKSHIQKHNANNFRTRRQTDASVKSFPCQYCNYVATTMGSLKLHVNSKHTRENMHKCPECDYECAVYGNLRMHVRRKHGLKPGEDGKYHCKECEFMSENASEMRIHMNEKHDMKIEIDDMKNGNQKVFKCQYCSYSTLYPQVMKKHTNKHTRQNVIKCPHCPYSTVWNHYMKVHIKRHNEPKTSTGRQRSTKPNTDQSRLFPCQYCDHRSLSFSSLRDHINSVHTREVVHKCPYCDHKCTLKGNLKGHIRRKHPAEYSEQEKRYQCEHCDFKTAERRNLKIHLKKEHDIVDAKLKAENGEYQCPHCEYKARSLYTLKIHRHKHTKENAYRCPQCEFATKWPNYLRKHIKQHSIGKSRVSCLYCEYKGCSTFRLRKHIEGLHKEGDFYPCPKQNCLFRTIHYTSLRMHLKGSIHASNTPRSHKSVSRNFSYKYRPNEGRYFACDYCDYASKTQGNLEKHIENKHEKKAMKCGLCSYRTPSKHYLKRHYTLKHASPNKQQEKTNEIKEETITRSNDSYELPDEIEDVEAPEISEIEADELFLSPDSAVNVSNECDESLGLSNRSKRKRSFVPYYAEESEDEDNGIICEDFLEVELGDKESNMEHDKELQEEDTCVPSIMDTVKLIPIENVNLSCKSGECEISTTQTELEEKNQNKGLNCISNDGNEPSETKIEEIEHEKTKIEKIKQKETEIEDEQKETNIEENKQEETKIEENKQEETKIEEKKQDETKIEENKPEFSKIEDNKIKEGKSEKNEENKLDGTKIEENKPDRTEVDENKLKQTIQENNLEESTIEGNLQAVITFETENDQLSLLNGSVEENTMFNTEIVNKVSLKRKGKITRKRKGANKKLNFLKKKVGDKLSKQNNLNEESIVPVITIEQEDSRIEINNSECPRNVGTKPIHSKINSQSESQGERVTRSRSAGINKLGNENYDTSADKKKVTSIVENTKVLPKNCSKDDVSKKVTQ